jgi:hypothetical protein
LVEVDHKIPILIPKYTQKRDSREGPCQQFLKVDFYSYLPYHFNN